MESVRKRANVVLLDNVQSQIYQTSKPGFKRFAIFNDELAGVELVKPVVVLDKPIYVGVTVLDSSKLIMSGFWYDVIKPMFPNCTLCFTDTDSLLIDVPTDDLYRDILNIKHQLDLSNYKQNHPLYDPTNKAVLGKFKDECAGSIIQEFVGLRSKCYSMLVHESEDEIVLKQINKAAGVKKPIRSSLHHELYKTVLFKEKDHLINQNLLRSYNHTIFSASETKVGLTAYDDKRYLLNDNISSRAHGHYLNYN